jgi:hypothetical protein
MADFHGLAAASLRNDHLQMDYLTETGPRLVRMLLPGSDQNLLGESPDVTLDTGEGQYKLHGGHRLWAAPEKPGWSYVADDWPLAVSASENSVLLEQNNKDGFGFSIRMTLAPRSPSLQLTHTVTNNHASSIQFAPWAITILPLGGQAVLPANGSMPKVELWPYSLRNDGRLQRRENAVLVSAEPGPAYKMGAFLPGGVCAYQLGETLLVKRFETGPGSYPDNGCNVEVYANEHYIELETLAPLAKVLPGQSVSFKETWDLYTGEEAKDAIHDLLATVVL